MLHDKVEQVATAGEEPRIERFDVAVLAQIGGGLDGFILARGTADQISGVRASEDFQRMLNCVHLVADNLKVADAFVDHSVDQLMSKYWDAFEET